MKSRKPPAQCPRSEEVDESCSPITLEYAEELLLMAYEGRCSVMDVSQIAKECPSGDQSYPGRRRRSMSIITICEQTAVTAVAVVHTVQTLEIQYHLTSEVIFLISLISPKTFQ